ncbi:MAG TPA: DJ-1/PfpI family protein, partial [Alphaproteobacteria bacterium]|nr:DJ-1/PfpI family protein [Alphaproteobacteria bacterium]
MMKPLSGTKIAVLVANGFEEKSFLEAQKMIIEMGATMRIISTNQGLVNGWDGSAWGHNYAVDAPLNTALGVDYNALVIPGGTRSIDKLKMTAHTRRFIGSFMASQKPVMVMGDAVMLMAHAEQLDGKIVAGPAESRALATQQGAQWSEESAIMDGAMLTGMVDENHK